MTHLGKPKLSSVFFLLVLCQQTFQRLSLSEIRPGRNDGAIRRGSAAGECYLSPGQTSLAVSLWPTPDVSECRCNTAGTSAAHDADAARRTRSSSGRMGLQFPDG